MRKKQIQKAIILISVIFAGVMSVSTAEAESENTGSYSAGTLDECLGGLNPAEREFFRNNDMVFRYDEEMHGPLYLPETGFSNEIRELHSQLKPEVMVEALYRIEYPDGAPVGPEEAVCLFSQIMRKVSTISGAMYFSRTKQDYAVLFEDVYAVNNMKQKKQIADPGPYTESVYLHMDEHSMGEGYYRIDYLNSRKYTAICLTNETAMGGLLRTVEPGDMKIFLEIIPCSDSILVYGYCGVVLQNDAIVMLLMDPYYSFYRRMTAMETWLYNSLHGTDRLPPVHEPMP